MDDATFFEVAQDADVWLYASVNWGSDVATEALADDLRTIPAYANGHVYDFLGRSGPKDWLESRFVQPDVVLEDFITILYPGVHLSHQRAWWRNVFSEGETTALSASSCRDISEPFELKSDPCFEASEEFSGDGDKDILYAGVGVVAGAGMMFACGALCLLATGKCSGGSSPENLKGQIQHVGKGGGLGP